MNLTLLGILITETFGLEVHRLIVVDHSQDRALEGKKPRKSRTGNKTL
jgi:hypothetical protein